MPNEVTERSYAQMSNAGFSVIAGNDGAVVAQIEDTRARWYAVWTRSRHEKSVSEHLNRQGIETFLPAYSTIRRWKNGDHRLDLPLFPGYTFVRIPRERQLQVLKVAGVVRLIGFSGAPSPLEDQEIESLRRALTEGVSAEPHPYLTIGRRVRITAGPLAGREGLLVRRKSAWRVVLSVDLIQRSVMVEAQAAVLQPIGLA